MKIGNGNLCGGNEEVIGACNLKGILFELGKLPRAGHGSAVYHVGRQYFCIAVHGVTIEEIADYCALKPCAQPAVDREPCAGYLACVGKIENAQSLSDIPMRLGLKAEFGRLAIAADLGVILVVRSVRNALMRNIRYLHKHIVKLRIDFGQLRIQLFDLVGDKLHFGEQLACVESLLLELRNLCGILVALGLECFDLHDEAAAFFVELEKSADIRALIAARLHCGDERFGILAYTFDIKHLLFLLIGCFHSYVGERVHHSLVRPQHFLYFLPLPQGQGSFGPIFLPTRLG